MARLIAGLGTSHIPSIGVALDAGKRDDPEWKPFFDGYEPARDWIADAAPDVAVVIYNDHGLELSFQRTVPTFAVGAADRYAPGDEGWGVRDIPAFDGAPDFSWHLIDMLVEEEFDPTICHELDVDHGVQVPLELFWGRPDAWPVRIVPIAVNMLCFPIPKPGRCFRFGKVLGEAIRNWPGDEKFVVIGTGGLSHQLQGARAGFNAPEADRAFLRDIAERPETLAALSREDFVERFGSEGAELIMWLVMRGALDDAVRTVHAHYHVPVSMTGAGMIVMENETVAGASGGERASAEAAGSVQAGRASARTA